MPADSFLSRWSKRKQESRATDPAPEQANAEVVATRSTLVPPPVVAEPAAKQVPQPAEEKADATEGPELQPVESLTPESDFRPFMQPDVDPAVRNQAMKTLFRDPHFNVMDMMDVYVDDYSKPDPIPEDMLRQMTQSRLLKLFDDLPEEEGKKEGDAAAQPEPAVADAPPVAELSQKAPGTTICPTPANGVASEPQQEKTE